MTHANLTHLTPDDIADAVGKHRPTAEQAQVIAGPTTPTLVVAGAGAGKTETMAARVVYLVATGKARPSRILGLTFTRKAAQQLRRRIRDRLEAFAASPACTGPDGARIAELIRTEDPRISTYDSYAGEFLSSYGLYVPVEPDVQIIDDTQYFLLAHSVVSEWDTPFPHSVKTITQRAITLAGELDSHLLSTDDVRNDDNLLHSQIFDLPKGPRQRDNPSKVLLGWAQAQQQRLELLDVVDAINARMRELGMVTFGQQMAYAAGLTEKFPEVVAAERRMTSVVLLDEYQDTGQAQRILLANLFGGNANAPLAVTAVGDPMQSIYGWRGASASNLASFIHDFPLDADTPARQLNLSTSWRNPAQILTLANGVTHKLRQAATETKVPSLKPRDGAEDGHVQLSMHLTEDDERRWMAKNVAQTFRALEEQQGNPPTAAVLIRRNSDAEPLESALRAEGLEVEIFGAGGLLDVPEVADIVALLRVAINPGDDTSALRLLSGDRFRLGAADLAALSARARKLSFAHDSSDHDGPIDTADNLRAALLALAGTENIDNAGLADAAQSPGAATNYTAAGKEAIAEFDRIVKTVRQHLDTGPAHALSIAETQLGLDVETRLRALRGIGGGRQQLDALQRYAADFATRKDATVPAFLDFLEIARETENGLAQEIVPRQGRVQIMTIHKAKGLEWQIVAVPHLVEGRFPKNAVPSNWVTGADQVPVHLRGDAITNGNPGGVHVPELEEAADRKELENLVNEHLQHLKDGTLEEDTRLFYVAITRSEQFVFASGFYWDQTTKVREPSRFLKQLKELAARHPGVARTDEWLDQPGDTNPLVATAITGQWPEQTPDAELTLDAARQVHKAEPLHIDVSSEQTPAQILDNLRAELGNSIEAARNTDPVDEQVQGWLEEMAVQLHAERTRHNTHIEVEIPTRLTATQHVALERDPAGFAANILRPMPQKPNRFARRGTTFHTWVEHYFSAADQFLISDDDLPGASDDEWEEASQRQLREQFLTSHWAQRQAVAVEVSFAIRIAGHTKEGKMDAVFRDPDSDGWIVVDWKTGAPPDHGMDPSTAAARKHKRDVAIQLAIYRVAWAAMLKAQTGEPVELNRIKAAFHYIGSGEDVFPEDLPDEHQLATEFERRFATAVEFPPAPEEQVD